MRRLRVRLYPFEPALDQAMQPPVVWAIQKADPLGPIAKASALHGDPKNHLDNGLIVDRIYDRPIQPQNSDLGFRFEFLVRIILASTTLAPCS